MRVRRALATGTILGWMLACGGTDATPIVDNYGQGGASANAGGTSSTGSAGASTGLSGSTAAGGAMGAGGASETGGAGGASGAGGSAGLATDAQAAPDGNLDAGSDVATMEAAGPQCAFDTMRCHDCIDTNVAGPCYMTWKICMSDTDPNSLCPMRWKDADTCACRYQNEMATDKALACINGLAMYGLVDQNLEACINSNCSKQCGLVP